MSDALPTASQNAETTHNLAPETQKPTAATHQMVPEAAPKNSATSEETGNIFVVAEHLCLAHMLHPATSSLDCITGRTCHLRRRFRRSRTSCIHRHSRRLTCLHVVPIFKLPVQHAANGILASPFPRIRTAKRSALSKTRPLPRRAARSGSDAEGK